MLSLFFCDVSKIIQINEEKYEGGAKNELLSR